MVTELRIQPIAPIFFLPSVLPLPQNLEFTLAHLKRVVKRLSIFTIKKKEPADCEPPHSAGIAYASHGLRNSFLDQPFDDDDDDDVNHLRKH